MPPAAWNWFTSAAAVRIDRARAAARPRDSSLKSSQLMRMPAARAIATRWMVWLVEPPVASRPTMRVDDRALVDDPADRRVVVAERGDLQRRAARRRGQRIAQRRVRVDEGGARQVQAHHLHQHLVAVGGAVEGAGAGRVVGCALRLRAARRGRPCPARSSWRTLRLLLVGQARRHRPARHEDRRQMAEGQRADQQARHDLVADAEAQRRVEHVVRQRDRGRHARSRRG